MNFENPKKKKTSIKLNIGSGVDYRIGYLNLDKLNVTADNKPIKVDMIHDFLKKPLPFSDNSVDEVVFRETLEHLNRFNGLKVLKDIYRIMKPGALLDLSVPPAFIQLRLLMIALSNAKNVPIDDFLFAHKKKENNDYTVWKRHDDLMGVCNYETDGTDGHSHKTLYTKETLRPVLEYVGFNITSIDDQIFVKAIK